MSKVHEDNPASIQAPCSLGAKYCACQKYSNKSSKIELGRGLHMMDKTFKKKNIPSNALL